MGTEDLDPPYVFLSIVFDGGLEDSPALVGVYPSNVRWFGCEYDGCCGLEGFLGCDRTWYEWMLHEGIAPGQRFVVRVPQPSYFRDYDGEYDVEYGDAYVVWKQPLPQGTEWMLWFAWFKDLDFRNIVVMTP
jgi:hypothetical protein